MTWLLEHSATLVRMVLLALCAGICQRFLLASCLVDSKTFDEAFRPDARTGTIKGQEVRRLMELARSVPLAQRYAIESNICQRILDFPLATNAHTTTWALIQKRSLFYDVASLDYWKTNHVAMLMLADHLGTHANISTKSFQGELNKARALDQAELARAKEKYKHDKEFPVGSWGKGSHQEAAWTRLRIIKIWNKDIQSYRGWIFGAFTKHISDCVRTMTQADGKLFIEEFIRRGKLSPDEIKQVFGSLPDEHMGSSGNSPTNAIIVVP